jgi:hypothetical protein
MPRVDKEAFTAASALAVPPYSFHEFLYYSFSSLQLVYEPVRHGPYDADQEIDCPCATKNVGVDLSRYNHPAQDHANRICQIHREQRHHGKLDDAVFKHQAGKDNDAVGRSQRCRDP